MRPLFAFAFNPYVIDIRDQYPVYDQETYNRARRRGERMPISAVQTYDIVLTLVLPPDNRLHYHGVSIKDARDQLPLALPLVRISTLARRRVQVRAKSRYRAPL